MLTHSRLTFVREYIKKTLAKNNRIYSKQITIYQCECGKLIECRRQEVEAGIKKSCGCLILTHHNRTTHGLNDHPIYTVWCQMKARCYNPGCERYYRYGGRGVTICEEWLHDFGAFYDWAIKNGWKEGLQIDKDIKGNGLLYSPDTCIFVTNKENANRRSHTTLITRDGQTKSIMQWCEIYGIKSQTLHSRIRTGWSFEKALTVPKLPNNKKYIQRT